MAASKTSKTNLTKSRNRWAVVFLMPQTIVFFGLSLYPIIMSYVYSFYSWDGASPLDDFVGLSNYVELFQTPRFWGSFLHTIYYVFGITIIAVGVSLILAIILNTKQFKGKAFYKTIYFLPVVTTTAIIGVIMNNIFGVNGLVNQTIQTIGIVQQPVPWLSDSFLAMLILIAVGAWKSLGMNMIYWLSGLQSIPTELYESAQLDGAGFWRTLFHVTLPLLKPILAVILLLSIVNGMHAFDLVKTLTNGDPYNSTETLDLYVFNYAFGGGADGTISRMGYASAAGVMLGIFTLIISIIIGGLNMLTQRKNNKQAAGRVK
ncbi:carbohydrate ABC transporter permease [Salibacterium sp. K-3]